MGMARAMCAFAAMGIPQPEATAHTGPSVCVGNAIDKWLAATWWSGDRWATLWCHWCDRPASGHAIARVANVLEPGAEIVLRKTAKGTVT